MIRALAQLCILVALAAANAGGVAAQQRASGPASPIVAASAPGSLFEVDGTRLHLHCIGSGDP